MQQYEAKAAVDDAIVQSGRAAQFDPVGFLHVVREVNELLTPSRHASLLDIGCANGLMEVVMSPLYAEILGIEPVSALVDRARQHVFGIKNVRVMEGDATQIPAADATFDRVLMLEVLQLIPTNDVPAVFREVRRVLRPGGILLIASIPDERHREASLHPYLDEVRAALHLSDKQKQDIIQRNERSHWYAPEDLVVHWQRLGCEALAVSPTPGYPHGAQRFHLVVRCP